MTEILKLKKVPGDGLETSWGALRLGIRTFFGINIRVRGCPNDLSFPRAEGWGLNDIEKLFSCLVLSPRSSDRRPRPTHHKIRPLQCQTLHVASAVLNYMLSTLGFTCFAFLLFFHDFLMVFF